MAVTTPSSKPTPFRSAGSSDDFFERLRSQRRQRECSVGDHLADRRVLQRPVVEIGTNGRHATNTEAAGNDDGAQEPLPLGAVGQCPTLLELIDDEHQLPGALRGSLPEPLGRIVGVAVGRDDLTKCLPQRGDRSIAGNHRRHADAVVAKQWHEAGMDERALAGPGWADDHDEASRDHGLEQRGGDVVAAEEIGCVCLRERTQSLVRIHRSRDRGAQGADTARRRDDPGELLDGEPIGDNTPSGRPTASRQAMISSAIDSNLTSGSFDVALASTASSASDGSDSMPARLGRRQRPLDCITDSGDVPASSSHSMHPKLKMSERTVSPLRSIKFRSGVGACSFAALTDCRRRDGDAEVRQVGVAGSRRTSRSTV